jgi:hypothetical protein
VPATMTTVDALLKEVYEDGPREQINQEVVALRRVERSSEGVSNEVGGRYVTFPIHTRRNSGVGARREMEALPSAGQQGHAAARVPLKYQYGTVQLSGQTIKLADSNYQAFASVLDNEVSGVTKDLAKNLNAQVFQDGSGKRAVCTTLGTNVNTFTTTNTQWIQLGYYYDLIDGTTLGNANPTVKASNRQATGITSTVVTLSGAVFSPAVGDILVVAGSVNREWTGIEKMVAATGSYQNIDPATEPVWAANVLANGGTNRALTEALMIQAVDASRKWGGSPSVGFYNLGVRRSYFNILQSLRQFVNTQEFTGGFSGLAFTTDKGDIPMVVDVDANPNTIWFLDESEIKLYRESDWSWMDMDGNKWHQTVSVGGVAGRYDAYEATLYQYSEIATHRRNVHSKLADITEA